jgi:hypothetical protein
MPRGGIIGTTNCEIDKMDKTCFREGRVQFKILAKYPTNEEKRNLLQHIG